MANSNDGKEMSPKELVKELNRVLGIPDEDDDVIDTDEVGETEEIGDTDAVGDTIEFDNDEVGNVGDNSEIEETHKSDEVGQAAEAENTAKTAVNVNAAFDTSIFDTLVNESDVITPFEFDDGLLGFSDTLDRIFDNDDDILAPSDDEITCDYIVKDKKQSSDTKAFEGNAAQAEDKQDEQVEQVGEQSAREKKHTADTATSGTERVPFNQTYVSDSDASSTDDYGYTDDENEIMNALGNPESERAETTVYDLDSLYSEELTEEEKRAEKERRIKKKSEKAKSRQRTAPGLEFTSMSQKKTFTDYQKRQYKSLNIRITLSTILACIMLLIESLAFFDAKFPHFMSLDKNPTVYVLILLQLFVLSAALCFTYIADGVRSVFSGCCKLESLTAIDVIFTVLYGTYTAATASKSLDLTYFSPAALCIVCTLIAQKRTLKREILSFRIASSAKPKYVLETYDISAEEKANSDIFSYLPENAKMMKINKTSFVGNFFSHNRSSCRDKSVLNIFIPIVPAVFILVVAIMLLTKNSLSTSLSTAFACMSLILPCGVFAAFTLPFYRLATSSFELDSTFIGESAADDFANASVVSFEDKEVFPAYGIKTSNFKQYDTGRVDYTMFVLASVFKKLGGPLGTVFASTAKELSLSDNVRIISVLDDGVEAMVDNDCILIGSASYMEENGMMPHYTSEDENSETSNDKRIMYVSSNGSIISKMSIKYNIDADFADELKQLSQSGVCIAIKTFDPNIDSALLSSVIDINKYPIRVLKCNDASEMSETKQNADADIISKGSPKSLLRTLNLCQRTRNTVRTGILSAILSFMIGAVIILLTLLSGSSSHLNAFYIVLYQLFWIIISYAISYFGA